MYRNYHRGADQTFPESDSGGSSNSSTGTTTASTHPQQKFSVAGSSHFVPSLNAITTSQDLQWMVEPSIMGPPGPSRSLRPPYPLPSGAQSSMGGSRPFQSHQVLRPGVIRAPTGSSSGHTTRRRNDDHLSPEEQERRRIRRERNKMAAAKCRNRRRELTDTLQSETDTLEDEKSRLQKEIANLQKEKEKLELVLEAHRPICKAQDSDSDSDSDSHPSHSHSLSHPQRHHPRQIPTLGGIKIEPDDSDLPGPSSSASGSKAKVDKPRPKITIPPPPSSSIGAATAAGSSTSSAVPMESETLNTPVLLSTPSLTPFTASLIFTYPSASLDVTAHSEGSAQNLSVGAGSSSSFSGQASGSGQPARRHHEPCGIAHRRSSSSGDQSDHSLHSPTILTL